MGLAVILVNWHNEEQTLRCIRAVRSWKAVRPAIVVVDNETTQTTRNTLTAFLEPGELISSHANSGYAGGNNLGIRQAMATECNYILLLNSDAVISDTGVSLLIDRLDGNPDITVLGPVIHEGQGRKTKCYIGGRDIARHLTTRVAADASALKTLPEYPLLDVDYVSGTVFLARRAAFDDVGLLDEEYFFSGEIADFCKRAQSRGYRVCVDLAVEAHHDIGETSPQLRETLYTYYSLRNRLLYVRKHYAPKRARYLAKWTLIGTLQFARAVTRGKLGKARAIVLALVDAYMDRYGDQNAKFT